MNIYLVRHLETERNKTGIYMGRSLDSPILESETPFFIEMIKRIQSTVARPVRLISSPAKRCRQTAEVIKDVLEVGVEVEGKEDFWETDMGEFEGKMLDEIREVYPELFEIWAHSTERMKFPGGESYKKAQDRSWEGLTKVVKESKEEGVESVFIVSHVDNIKLIVAKVMGFSIDKKRFFDIDNGSVTGLKVGDDGELRLQFLNFT